MQITDLSTSMFDHLTNILATETEHRGEPQVHPDVQHMLTGDTGILWSSTLVYLTNTITNADFGTLDKVKDHPERNKAAGEAAQAFVNALGMAMSKIQEADSLRY